VKRSVSRRSRSGVTIPELAVALAILGIVGTLVIPAIVRPVHDEQPTAAAPILDALRIARQTATDSGRPTVVRIDPVRRWYVVELEGADAPLARGALALGAGVQLASDSVMARFSFDPSGVALGSDSLQVRTGSDPHALLVTVDAWTGEPRARRW
jgi:prepilin-type N-terminal cleavage/methylation domain-containing protein